MSTCIVCGEPLTQKPMGRPRAYCGDTCRAEVAKARRDLKHYRGQAEAAEHLAAQPGGDAWQATATTAAASYRAAAELVAAADAVAPRLRTPGP